MGERVRIDSDGVSLSAYVARGSDPADDLTAAGDSSPVAALVLCHGYPNKGRGAKMSGKSFPQLADRLAEELGWVVLSLSFRGCADSEGDFSLEGWKDDIGAAVGYLVGAGRSCVWLAGFGTGGSLCLAAGAENPAICGVACCGAPAGFDDWARHPRRLVAHSRDVGVIRDPAHPADLETWSRGLRSIRPVDAAERLAPRPLLVLHGSADDVVPVLDALAIIDAHGAAEHRVIDGGGHELRHDPRAVAVLSGWLARMESRRGEDRRSARGHTPPGAHSGVHGVPPD